MPLLGVLCHDVILICWLGLDIAYLCTQFGHISRSRDMVDAHQILHSSHDLITPLSGRFVTRGLVLATINLPTKFEVSIFTHYKDIKGDTKIGVVWGY